MKKKIIITIVLLIMTALSIEATTNYRYYKKLIKRQGIGRIRECWSEDLDWRARTERGDDILIEKIVGTVTNARKDGKIMGADPEEDYISYRRVKGARKGDTILTICIYTPGNAYGDDICERFDYIIDRQQKKR